MPLAEATRDELVTLTDQHAFIGIPTFDGGQVLVYNLAQLVDDEPAAEAPSALLLSVAPNPVAGRATVRFELPHTGAAQLAVYDVLGREVARIVEDTRPAGAQTVEFDVRGLGAGVYLLRLQTEGEVTTQRFTVVR